MVLFNLTLHIFIYIIKKKGFCMLVIKNLTKKYGDKVVVDNLSLTVWPGEICAFIGHNGAGKTTTLKTIAGIIDFDEGQITVGEYDVKKDALKAKEILHYLPDNPLLYEHLTGLQQLNFIADVFGLREKERQEKIYEYAKRLEIYDDLNSKISTYSHGMKQKLALVSALIHSPKLLLLDEPFVGLDPKVSHELKLIMQELASKGVAIFYSTHVLDVAEKICSHFAIIKKGKLIEVGKMEDVKDNMSLETIYLEKENEQSN